MYKNQQTKTSESQFEINFNITDEKNIGYTSFNFRHTKHSFVRAAQRGINSNKIEATLKYGESIFKQGLIYYILGQNNIPKSLYKDKNKLINTVVVVAGDSNQVITCYRSSNPYRNIKIKQKQLANKIRCAA